MTKPRLVFACLALLVAASACQKVTSQARILLVNAVNTTKERAVAFAAIASKITAKDPANAAKVNEFAAMHADELSRLADSMFRLNSAVLDNGSVLDDNTRKAVWEEAATSAARAADFKIWTTKFLAPSSDLDAHLAGLNTIAQTMQLLATALPLADGTLFGGAAGNGGAK